MIAHAGWIYHPLNEFCAFGVFDGVDADDVDNVDEQLDAFICVDDVVVVFWGDIEFDIELVLLIDDDVCGGVLEQFDDPSILLLSILFNRVSSVVTPLLIFVETGNVDADFIIWAGIENDNSCNPSNFSNSLGSLAPGKSCLFANINIGTPCKWKFGNSLCDLIGS